MGRFLALDESLGRAAWLVLAQPALLLQPGQRRIEPIGFNANALDPASAEIDLARKCFITTRCSRLPTSSPRWR